MSHFDEQPDGDPHGECAAEIARLVSELRYIANADVESWDDPSEFKAWAQNRARAALTQPTEQP